MTEIGFDIYDGWIGAILLADLTDDYKALILGIESDGKTAKSEDNNDDNDPDYHPGDDIVASVHHDESIPKTVEEAKLNTTLDARTRIDKLRSEKYLIFTYCSLYKKRKC